MNTIDASVPGYNYDISPFRLVNNLYTSTYKLFISKVDSKSLGYYWCSVVSNSGMVQPNPSKVLHVADRCSIQDADTCLSTIIPLQQNVTGVQCANSAPSVSVVAAQNIDCMPSTTAAVSEVPTKPVLPITTTDLVSETTTMEHVAPTTKEISTTGSASTALPPNYKPTTHSVTKPTTPPATKPKDIEHSTPTTVVLTSTQETDTKTVSENGTGMSQGDNGLPLDVIWLGIGVILAVLLTAVMILLTIIACLQCKKRRIKGKVHGEVYYYSVVSRWVARQTSLTICVTEHAEMDHLEQTSF